MSKIAGLLLMIYGGAAGYLGWTEHQQPHFLTHAAAYSTLGIGGALLVAGLGHFRAPHKSFLLSVPLLAYFHVQSVVDATMYRDAMWPYQCALLVGSLIILFLSYRGYKEKQAAAAQAR